MRIPDQDDLRGLLRWRARHGVVSVYLDLRPEDRGESWRIELRNGLAAAVEHAGDGSNRREVSATANRIEERFDGDRAHPSGRTQIGFIEVGSRPRREEWFAVQTPLDRAEIVYARRPSIGPLVAILDGGPPRGVALLSAERVRLLEWSLGGIRELASWGLEIFSLDWRERKSQRSSDPARVQGAKGSGRDQFDQRLEANRERFLHEAGRLAVAEFEDRRCAEVLAFGEPAHVRRLGEGIGSTMAVRQLEPHNLISEPADEVLRRVDDHLSRLRGERERALVKRATDEARGGDRGALGRTQTIRALDEGRVAHLLVATEVADRSEQLVERALETSASVTPVQAQEAAEALAGSDGVAALLRY